jgi:hypothetical protein
MNTELLTWTRDYIQAHPDEIAMREWDCGSTACIGGHACRLAGKPITLLMLERFTHFKHARTVLDLTIEQARDLFFLDSWPTEFRYRYEKALETLGAVDGRTEAAAVVVERIDHFIEQNMIVVS